MIAVILVKYKLFITFIVSKVSTMVCFVWKIVKRMLSYLDKQRGCKDIGEVNAETVVRRESERMGRRPTKTPRLTSSVKNKRLKSARQRRNMIFAHWNRVSTIYSNNAIG